MFIHIISGLVLGFIAGLVLNSYLLRNIPRERYLRDPSMRIRYGTLNWVIAVLGAAVAMLIA